MTRVQFPINNGELVILYNFLENGIMEKTISYDSANYKKIEEKENERLNNFKKEYEEKSKHYRCSCGSKILKSSKTTHEKSKKHQKFINQ